MDEHPERPTLHDESLALLPSSAREHLAEWQTVSAAETLGRPSHETVVLEPQAREPGDPIDTTIDLVTPTGDLRFYRSLGQGGMGRVFLAQQHSLNRKVAVKTTEDPVGATALLAEAVITGMLEHPNIPPIHQLGKDAAGRPVLVMKRIEGATWAELLADPEHPVRTDNPLFQSGELDAHIEILIQVCNALQFAHARDVFHRDIKPSNVMIGAFGEVMLIDWGVAFARGISAPERNQVVGSPGYMAPEMARGEEPDARTDVYLLGSSLHQVLTGRPRHDARNAAVALVYAMESKPYDYPPSLPSALTGLCNRATSAAPEDRPASALEFAQELRRFRSRRTASEINDRTAVELSELEARSERPEPDDFAERAAACRVSLLESLRAWPENEAALALQIRLHCALLQRSLATGDLAVARLEANALEARNALPDALRERLGAAEKRKREQNERDRELDLEMGRRSREALIAVVVVALVPVQIYRWLRPWTEIDPARYQMELVWIWAFISMPVFVGALVFRRRLGRTAEGRRLLGVVLLGLMGVGVHRVLAVWLEPGLTPTVAGDLLVMGTGVLTGASWLGRPFILPGLIFFAAALAVTFVSTSAGLITNISGILAALAFMWAQRRVARSREADSTSARVARS